MKKINDETNTRNQQAENEFKEKAKRVSDRIGDILKEENMGLQTFLTYSEFGIIPSVRLTNNPSKSDDKKEEGK